MAVTYEVFEILERVEKAKTRDEKIKILRQFNVMPVRDVLQGTFDDNIQWNLPEGTPPYTPNNEDAPAPSSLRKQHMKFKFFVKGLRESEQLNRIKRERMFIDMLESVAAQDAKLLIKMINKEQPVKGLTKKLVQEAYPDLIPNS
jgi:hypothetical protein